MFKTEKLTNIFKQNPLSLIIVAFIFLGIGVETLFEMLMSFYNKEPSINPLPLGILVFFGLLMHKNGWRTCALIFIWFVMIVIPPLFILNIINREFIRFNVFGVSSQTMSLPVVLFTLLAFFLIVFWFYKVLTSKKIRQMFIPEKKERI